MKFFALLSLVFLFVPACKGGGESASIDPQAQAKADTVWNERCVSCHGANGDGKGPQAAALGDVKPRSFRVPQWQASVDDAYITKVIVEGGTAVGKSALMAPNSDLAAQPETVKMLVKKIRGFTQ